MICPHCKGRNFGWSRRCEHCARPLDPSEPSDPAQPAALPDLTLAIPESPEVQEREARKAAIRSALAERGTRVVLTPMLMAANVLMFVLMAIEERQVGSFAADTLLEWGGSYSPDVTQGAWWRLITAVFLHGGLLHISANMVALAVIGPVTERLYGSAAFAVLYALAGIAGAVASEWWQPVSVGVGASGAIVGLYGGLFAFLLRRHTTLPRPVVSSLATGAGTVVVYTIIAGFTQSYIDNAGHLGGLIGGFLAGLALTPTGNKATATVSRWRLVNVSTAGLVIAALGVAALPRYGDYRRNVWQFSELDNRTLAAAYSSLETLAMGGITEEDCALALEELLPPWRDARATMASLRVPSSEQPLVGRIVRYMDARDRAWTLTADAMRTRDVALLAKSQEAHGEAMRALGSRIGGPRRAPRAARGGAITFGSSELNGELRRAQRLDDTLTRAFNDRMTRVRTGRMSLPELAAALEKDTVPPWAEQYKRVIEFPAHGPADWTRQPVAEFMRRRLEAWRLTARAARERNGLLMRRAEASHADAVAFLQASTQPPPVPDGGR